MRRSLASAVLASLLLIPPASADPCGMVPPLRVSAASGPVIARVGAQRTYVAFRDGIETIALRPAFQGSIDDFGMLIPFPSPPAVRKIEDDTFAHIEAALAPPTVRLSVQRIHQPPFELGSLGSYSDGIGMLAGAKGTSSAGSGFGRASGLAYSEVRVVRQEAVGMYQVAVLEAGSPAALSRWMLEHGYRYPDGMDDVTAEYVEAGWCFVAIKATVGSAGGVSPRPGMRTANPQLPTGATFSGHVQGMAFRFEAAEPVVPMRLSVFNGPDPRNVVYLLAEQPMIISGLPDTVQVRHRSGADLHQALTAPLPLKVTEGSLSWLPAQQREAVAAKRDSGPYTTAARDLFASDLLAMRTGQLALTHETEATALLNISTALGLRGPEIDALHADETRKARARAVDGAVDDLHEMHMTVMDGIFPADLLRSQDLTFERYTGPRGDADQRSDDLQRPDISGQAVVNTATSTTSLSWQKPARPRVSGQLGAPQITGSSGPLDDALIQRVVRRHQNALRYCYIRILQQNPSAGGSVLVRVMISPEGRVQSAGVSQGLGSPALDQCIVNRFRQMRFPPGDENTLVQLRLFFSPDF